MRNPYWTLLMLISPIIFGLLFLLCIPFIKIDTINKIKLSIIEIIGIELPITSPWPVRISLFLVALSLFSIPAFKDYSDFFPSRYDMEVFFDNIVIEKSLKDYTNEDIISFNLATNWKEEKSAYLKKLTKDISTLLGIKDFFERGAENVHSIGDTSFVVDKVEGWQYYYIREAKGQLRHYLEYPNDKQKYFDSRFELLNTSDNYIHATLYDIFIGHSKILLPRFKQIVFSQNKDIYHHNLIAAIKIQFFPICKIYNTIYLVKCQNTDKWFPIGCAIYKPSK